MNTDRSDVSTSNPPGRPPAMPVDKTRTKKWAPKTFNGCLTCKYVYLIPLCRDLPTRTLIPDPTAFLGRGESSVTRGSHRVKGESRACAVRASLPSKIILLTIAPGVPNQTSNAVDTLHPKSGCSNRRQLRQHPNHNNHLRW